MSGDHVSCDPAAPDCGRQFIRSFGEKAFRRPLTGAEVNRYLQVLPSGGFELMGASRPGPTFNGVGELAAVLAGSREVQDCFALQWVRFGYGVTENADLSCLVRSIQSRFAQGNLRIDELIVALATSPHMFTRVGAPR